MTTSTLLLRQAYLVTLSRQILLDHWPGERPARVGKNCVLPFMPLAPHDNRPAWLKECGIKGCEEEVSSYFEPSVGRWACKCHRATVTVEGKPRLSHHRAWWDDSTQRWHWTTRGFVETGLAKLPKDAGYDVDLSALPYKRYPLLLQTPPMTGADTSPRQAGTGSQELVDGTLQSNINLPAKDTDAQENVCVTAGSPRNSAISTDSAENAPTQAEHSTLTDEPVAMVCAQDHGCDEREVATPARRCTNSALPSVSPASAAASTMENSQTTSMEEASGSEDAWSTGGRGCKGRRRDDCRLCHTPRADDVPEQRGQFCWACKESMRKHKQRKTSHLKCLNYRRTVREESLQIRREASGQLDGSGSVQGHIHLDQEAKGNTQPDSATSTCNPNPATIRSPSPDKLLICPAVISPGPIVKPAGGTEKCGQRPETSQDVDPVATSWGTLVPCPRAIHIDPQRKQLCAMHALRNAVQDTTGHTITEELLSRGAERAAKRFDDDTSVHQDSKGEGNFSIEAVAEAVMQTDNFSMRCLSSLSETWDKMSAITVVEQAFADVEGLPVAGLLVHIAVRNHYVALLLHGPASSAQILLLDSLHPATVQILTAESFKTLATSRKRTRRRGKSTQEPRHFMFQIVRGKLPMYDATTLAHAAMGRTFSLRDTPGAWHGDIWFPKAS